MRRAITFRGLLPLAALAALAACAGAAAAAPAAAPAPAPAATLAPAATHAPAAPAAPAAAPAPEFTLSATSVGPRHAYVAGSPVRIAFTIAAATALALDVDVVREATGKPVRRFALAAAAPGVAQRITWDAITGGGAVAPNGSYRVRVRSARGTARRLGTLTLRSHVYPIRGAHADRGPIGRFGVGRSGGRTHEGYDVNAACGTPLVAARGGRVVRSDYDPVLYGNVVIVRGDHTRRDYWYAHLQRPSALHVGDHVRTGGRIGRVGATGNARTVGCHLHFELHVRGVAVDPAPELHAWDRWS
jgi:murein DD-endopeptidase MepM/ murein hydrolase activator NlpD